MSGGLLRQALRRHRWAFLGPLVTQCVAAAVVATMVTTGRSVAVAPLTLAERRAVDDAEVATATAIFAVVGGYMAAIIVGVTMASTIAQQARDIALLRAVGATPGRVRRSVALQAVLVALPGAVLGFLASLLLGPLWTDAMVDRGILPEAVRYRPQVWVLAMVVGIAAGTSLVGGLVAAVRPSRVRPAVALSETGVRRRVGPVRVVLGGVLVAGGAALSVPVARLQADRAASTSVLVMLALCLGIGLLGPVILRAVSRLARAPMGALGGSGVIAVDNLGAASKALSGALVPLVLAVAFATVQVALHTTPPHVTGVPEPAAGPWLDYSGTAVYCAFAAVAALNTLITVGIGRRRELAVSRLAGATRGRVLGIVVCEAVLVTATALVLAAGVAGTVLAPMLHTAQHTWLPYLPPWYLAGAVGGALALVAAGTLGPAAVLTARSAIEAVDPAG